MLVNHNYAGSDRMPSFQERFWELKGDKSFEVIARAIGSNKSSLSMFVSGKLNIKKDMIKDLANYFNVDQAYLLGESDIPRQNTFDRNWEKLKAIAIRENYTLDEVEEALMIVRTQREYAEKKRRK